MVSSRKFWRAAFASVTVCLRCIWPKMTVAIRDWVSLSANPAAMQLCVTGQNVYCEKRFGKVRTGFRPASIICL